MKKTIVLLTIVLAVLAAPLFAEVTVSGDVDYRFGYNADAYSEGSDMDFDAGLGIDLSDYTSISLNFSADNEVDAADDNAVTLDNLVLTQDITGAMGMDGDFGVALSLGVSSFEPVEYNGVAGYGDFEYSDEDGDNRYDLWNILDPSTVMTKASISVSDVTIDAALYETGSEVFDAPQFGVNVYGTFGIVDASVNLLYVKATVGEDLVSLGANFAAEAIEDLMVGAGMEMFLSDGEWFLNYGVSVGYTFDALSVGFAMKSDMESRDFGYEFMDVTDFAINVNYMVTEAAKVFAGFKIAGDENPAVDTDFADAFGYELGASYTLDVVTYSLGWADGSDYVGQTGSAVDGAVFARVQASF